MALIFLIDKMVSLIDKCDLVLGFFLDLSKAFDMVHHTKLLHNYTIIELGVFAKTGSKLFDTKGTIYLF